jgi:hypothetical protein
MNSVLADMSEGILTEACRGVRGVARAMPLGIGCSHAGNDLVRVIRRPAEESRP